MKNQFTVFYSWQSDISKNRKIIMESIEMAIKSFTKKDSTIVDIEINLDRDTLNETGSISISDTILKKISISDIYICDVTLINNTTDFPKYRLTSNPNVLFELGFALNQLGWDRVICINNLEFGKNEQLPFDIRGHRITTFNSTDKDCKSKLKAVLIDAITSILTNYDEITKKFNIGKIRLHDKEIFLKINEICREEILNDTISQAVDSLFSNGYYYSIWENLINSYTKTLNHFVDSELHHLYSSFLKSLDEFRMHCYTNFDLKKSGRSLIEFEEAGIEITKEIEYESLVDNRYSARKEPFPKETWKQADKRNQKLQQELFEMSQRVKKDYKELIIAFKRKQL